MEDIRCRLMPFVWWVGVKIPNHLAYLCFAAVAVYVEDDTRYVIQC